jgi:hypothetical protein
MKLHIAVQVGAEVVDEGDGANMQGRRPWDVGLQALCEVCLGGRGTTTASVLGNVP